MRIKLFSSICLLYLLSLNILCKTSFPNKYPPTALSRRNLVMPRLVDEKKFKDELPLDELKTFRFFGIKNGSVSPILKYTFSIDKDGNVVKGKFNGTDDKRKLYFILILKHFLITINGFRHTIRIRRRNYALWHEYRSMIM